MEQNWKNLQQVELASWSTEEGDKVENKIQTEVQRKK